MSIQSDDLNLLIFRYLEESGFQHSAFTFGRESNIQHVNIGNTMVPPGALVSVVLKGMLYADAEISLNEDGSQLLEQGPMTLLESVSPDFIAARLQYQGGAIATQGATSASAAATSAATTGVPPAVVPVAEKEKEPAPVVRGKCKSDSNGSDAVRVKPDPAPRVKTEAKVKQEPRPVPMDTSVAAVPDVQEPVPAAVPAPVVPPPNSEPVAAAPSAASESKPVLSRVAEELSNHTSSVRSPPVVQATTAPAQVTPSADTDCKATVLRGHTSEVYICAWNPTTDALASGAGDGTACIWNEGRPTVLPHEREMPVVNGGDEQKNSTDVTSLDWSQDGSLLATASYDHIARVWNPQGKLLHKLSGHQGPIFAIKFNRRGTFILTGSVDKTAVVWDAATGTVRQQFAHHTAPCLDIDWQGSSIFATCSQDSTIHVCRVGYEGPLKVLRGHKNEVNTVRWNPAGNLLASCSDDHTAKLWTIREEKCLHNLESHTREIYTIKWSRTGPFTAFPNAPLRLATASFDSTVRLWDAEVGTSLSCLRGHGEAVYSVAFNPDAQLLASGSFDNCVHIWSTRDAQLLHKYKGNAGVFEVCFNRDGTKIAASSADHSLVVLDVRNLQTRLN